MQRVSHSLVLASLLLLPACWGCQSWHEGTGLFTWRGKGYADDDLSAMTRNLRPPGDERQYTGIDARARDIESNLGVR